MSAQGNVNAFAQYPLIASAFVADYYNKMSRNRAEVVNLYHPEAMMTYEGEEYFRRDKVSEKLAKLQFSSCEFRAQTFDAHPVSVNQIFVMITGMLLVDGETNPTRFAQFLTLEVYDFVPPRTEAELGVVSALIRNDIFRLNYG
ncbi:3254_t:CDS:2 [Paraglomus brasilianum]|uniref:NTF2-related export protein n=1 Tax=Paraglomus brasilianum TaxID=144538 RepID=A0A9N8Z7Q4_9GLOM|nr:3254_t:CDS:2 [Paraglomus brasilianum]